MIEKWQICRDGMNPASEIGVKDYPTISDAVYAAEESFERGEGFQVFSYAEIGGEFVVNEVHDFIVGEDDDFDANHQRFESRQENFV